MTLPSYSFTGADFFSRVRFEMDRNRGMFGGSDGDLQFVVMDGLLYRLEIFQRPAHQNFTDAGQALQIRDPDIRVLVNGQTMGLHWYQYATQGCLTGPCSLQMNGEIIVSGTPLRGDPPSYPSHRFFGRENAIPLWRYHMNQGDPSSYRPILYHAMGKLVPLIQGRIRFGNGDIGTPPNIEQIHSGATDDFIKFGASVGKTLVGIHRASGCLFVICQEDDASNGMDVETLRDRLQTMGVDDVVICDSSDSATLLVDGTIHATPALHKNNSIPTGLMFRLLPLGFGSGATFRVDGGTDTQFLDRFPVETELRGMEGTITPRIGGGLELIIDSFGAVPPFAPHEVAAEMGIALLPVTLIATGTDLTYGETFSSISPNLTISLTLTQLPGQIDGLEGTLEVTNDRGTITGTIEIPI